MDSDFSKKIIALSGKDGEIWLNNLPNIVKKYEKKWNIQCSKPFPPSYNYVLSAKTADQKDAVLKISFPHNHEFQSEIDALHYYDGEGSIAILKEDFKNGVVLLERAVPGTRIGNIQPDEKQISIVSEVIQKIHRRTYNNMLHSFPTLLDWAKAFERYRKKYHLHSGPIPKRMFEEAEEIFFQFSKNTQQQYVLHGDLHNDNILLSERGWVIIDPKGVVGEQSFDVGTYLRNPYTDISTQLNIKKTEERRILQFSDELHIDKKKIQQWTFANAVISALWFLEDENQYNTLYLRNAELISEIQI